MRKVYGTTVIGAGIGMSMGVLLWGPYNPYILIWGVILAVYAA